MRFRRSGFVISSRGNRVPCASPNIRRGVMELSSKQRRHLKGLAHHLKPVVQVGNHGISKAVLNKVSFELELHELIKVKLSEACPLPKREAAAALSEGASAALVQLIGRTVVLFKQRKKDSEIKLP